MVVSFSLLYKVMLRVGLCRKAAKRKAKGRDSSAGGEDVSVDGTRFWVSRQHRGGCKAVRFRWKIVILAFA